MKKKKKENSKTTPQSLQDQLNSVIAGTKIQKIELNEFDDGRGDTAYNPVIHLEDGTSILFTVTETEIGEYGVSPAVWRYGKKIS